MTNKPDFIDNRDGNTLAKALARLIEGGAGEGVFGENPPDETDEARIATAYFSPAGFARIAQALENVGSIKLLLGSDPIADGELWHRNLEENENRFINRRLKENLKKQEQSLRLERNHVAFSKTDSTALKHLAHALQKGNMQVRRYEQAFLHAKGYIFTAAEEGAYGKTEAVIAGSSNLTVAGLTANLELNLGRYDTPTVTKAKDWFDALWAEASAFDLAQFFTEVFDPKTPFEIFLRVLWQIYGKEIEQEATQDDDLPLTTFQYHGVVRALRLINEVGGAIVADEVGLGKTYLAGAVLKHYEAMRQRALLICPASLRDSSWQEFIHKYRLYLETVSFEELALDEQLYDGHRRPKSTDKKLQRPLDEYQLVIIDEAHNYRNPDSPYRADALRGLLRGRRKDVLMLTATPVNNSLWDLYHLTRFFIKQDAFLADKGILSIRDRFAQAMRADPNNLSPDVLYPIIDATTVKRTRQFVKKHYHHDKIEIDGTRQTIVFPEPNALTVRYKIDALMPGLFDLIEIYLDPENAECLTFARYKTNAYLRDFDDDDAINANATTGLLLSGLLKRFESSTGAFRISIERLIDQHQLFLTALDSDKVLSTEFFKELASTDDEDFDELLRTSEAAADASLYHKDELARDVRKDLEKLEEIHALLEKITPEQDPKLRALIEALKTIIAQAEKDGILLREKIDNRKVIIFSFFADTVRWINDYLKKTISLHPELAEYQGRIAIVVGSGVGEDMSKAKAAREFAPDTAGGKNPSKTDILISTDVLAEGVNLQQARHIINYDMPWNPMRLVQRHGRIDRIGSQHKRVFMRTIFPIDRLDRLLNLEENIARKIAMAASTIGVFSPIKGTPSATRNFTETRDEIHNLLAGNPALYERGGTIASVQSGEEYRHTLRKEMEDKDMRKKIMEMAWKSGSAMRRGTQQGIFFCATVRDKRTYLRFVHANADWSVKTAPADEYATGQAQEIPIIDHEIGRCLRIIECDESAENILTEDDELWDAAYDLWDIARDNIHEHWHYETDPRNIQPRVRPLNRKVAKFIRENKPPKLEKKALDKLCSILEAPWPMRDEKRLREWFEEDLADKENLPAKGSLSAMKKAQYLIDEIFKSGLEPFTAPKPLPPIDKEFIELIAWMAIVES